ncbi:hypothetical protein EG856_02350 [Mycoplasmopsis phocirhinis]|uniref:Uncharacterized protein n=1 Tax=Mycoplasmopsis phocirhinis TaxID=142650 RepID=A0A4P6MTP6_9BACT|nr:hypothetical protein [Mycoplasmopsis phocirhinis]QBF34747.1 hypothetical protein EG856_02350 [Mycoplasmopsis phocirhinis]
MKTTKNTGLSIAWLVLSILMGILIALNVVIPFLFILTTIFLVGMGIALFVIQIILAVRVNSTAERILLIVGFFIGITAFIACCMTIHRERHANV